MKEVGDITGASVALVLLSGASSLACDVNVTAVLSTTGSLPPKNLFYWFKCSNEVGPLESIKSTGL